MSSPSPSPFFFLLPLSFSISVPGLRAVAMATVGCRMCDGGVWGSPPVILTSALPESNKAHPPPHTPHRQRTYICSHPAFYMTSFFICFLCFVRFLAAIHCPHGFIAMLSSAVPDATKTPSQGPLLHHLISPIPPEL